MDNNSNALYLEIAKFKAGNFADYQSFYNLTSGYIYNLILAVVKDANAAANVNNLVYDRIYKSIGQLTDDSFFYQWAGTIATDESLNYLLQNGLFSVQAVAPDASDNMYSALDMFADTESYISADFMADEEKKRIVNEVISALSPVQQLVLQYYFYEGLRIADIAYRLRLSNTGVKQIIEQIKHAIKPYVGGTNGQTKLKTIGELPFVWMLFASATGVPATVGIFGARATVIGAVGVAGAATNMSGNAATGGTIGAGMAGSGVAGAGMTGGVAGTGVAGSVGAVGAATGTAASGVATAAAGTAAKVGLGIGAKVAIGVAGAAVVVGGGIGAFRLINKPDKEPIESVQTVTDAVTEEITTEEIVTEETTEATTEEVVRENAELFKEYLDITLIPEKGVVTGETQSGEAASYVFSGEHKKWLDISQTTGIVSALIDDFDSDGSDEMVVFYVEELANPVKRGYDYDEMNNTIPTEIPYDGRANELKYALYSVENGEVVLSDSNDFRYLNTYFGSMNGRERYDELPTIVHDDISEDKRLFMSYTTDDNGQKCFVLEYRHTGGMGYTDLCNHHKCALFKVENDTFIPYAYAASNASHQASGVIVVADMENYVALNVQSQPNVNTANSDSYEADGYAIWRSFMDSRGFARAKCVAWSAIGFEYEQSSTDSILDLELDNAILFSLNVYVADEGDWTSTPCIMGYQTNIYDRQGLLGR